MGAARNGPSTHSLLAGENRCKKRLHRRVELRTVSMKSLSKLAEKSDGARALYLFSVAAGVSPAVEGGILPPGANARCFGDPQVALTLWGLRGLVPPGRMPGSPPGETPAATPLNTYRAFARFTFRGGRTLEMLDLLPFPTLKRDKRPPHSARFRYPFVRDSIVPSIQFIG